MKQRVYGLFAVLMAVLLAVGVSAAAGMYVYDSETGGYYSADGTKLDTAAVSIWLDDNTAAGYLDPNYLENYVDPETVCWFDELKSGWYEVVLCGLGGDTADFAENMDGKIAFCIRGDSPFRIKAANAKSAGAVACIIGNNWREEELMDENGNITSGMYANITMSMSEYSLPVCSLSSDITVSLLKSTTDASTAEIIEAMKQAASNEKKLELEAANSVWVFLGTEAEFATANGTEANVWHYYRNIQWYFDDTTGTLTIAGDGKIPEGRVTDYPWYIYRYDASSIVISEGITNFPTYAFSAFSNYINIQFPSSLIKLDHAALAQNGKLKNISVDSSNQMYFVRDGVLFEKHSDAIIVESYAGLAEDGYIVVNGYKLSEREMAQFRIGSYDGYIPGDSSYYNFTSICKKGIVCKINSFDAEETVYHVETTEEKEIDFSMSLLVYPRTKDDCISYTIPEGVTRIAEYAFTENESLTELSLPNSLCEIEDYSLSVENLVSLHIPENVCEISITAIKSLELTEITVALQNTDFVSVDGILFSKDMTLLHTYPYKSPNTVYTVPDSIVTMTEGIYLRTTNLEILNIPASVTNVVKQGGWSYHGHLKEVHVAKENPKYCSVDGILYTKDMSTLLYYPVSKPESVYHVPDSVTTIGFSAIYELNCLEQLYFGNGIKDLGDTMLFGTNLPVLNFIYFPDDVPENVDVRVFQSFWWNGKRDQITLYYVEGREGWSSTVTLGGIKFNAAPYESTVPGDASNDGELNEADAAVIAEYFAGHTDVIISDSMADIDHNGEVERYDAMYLARALAGWEGYDLPEGFQSNTGN